MKFRKLSTLVLALLFATLSLLAGSSTDLLLTKARSLEGRGRPDLAQQIWQQVLMTEPGQPEALAALARFARQNGRTAEAAEYVERLRKINPNDPAIAQIEAIRASAPQTARLEEAAKLARNQQYEQAMSIYREVFPNGPSAGGWATAYYETEAATQGGWKPATASLQQLAGKYPENQEYKLSLGRLLTYKPETRIAGIRLLESVQGGPGLTNRARQAWRQALLWESANPAADASLKAYLSRYPDAELATREAAQSAAGSQAKKETNTGLAQGREEEAGYRELKAGRIKEAEAQFQLSLKATPDSIGALAGLGFVRMKQEDFKTAEEYFTAAKQQSPGNKIILEALETASFWKLMKNGTLALGANQTQQAVDGFQKALFMRPASAEALQGLAGAYQKRGDSAEATSTYERLLKLQPQNASAWRELINAKYQAGDPAAALTASAQIPPAVAVVLWKDVAYLAMLASINFDAGKNEESRKALQQAVDAANAQHLDLSLPLQLQFAGLYLQNGHPAQAALVYQRVADANPQNLDAWEGLLAALIQTHNEARATAVLQRMPKEIYQQAQARPGFLRSVAALYTSQNQLDGAEQFLRKALTAEGSKGSDPTPATQLQLAQIWLKQGHGAQAERLLRELSASQTENPDVWKSLIAALHEQKKSSDALAESERVPPTVRSRLLADPDYMSLLAAIYNAGGEYDEALRLVEMAKARYESDRRPVPFDLEVQLAWLLLNSKGDERQLYVVLKHAGSRSDLTAAQQNTVNDIWTTWTLRTADSVISGGDLERGIGILQTSLRTFPKDAKIHSALAGNLLKASDTKRAFAEYKSWGLANAGPQDFAGAIGSAMAERNSQVATTWLQQGLHKWPTDPLLLEMAGKQAAQKLDYKKAERYWRAALAAMPKDSRTVPGGGNSDPFRSLGEALLPGAEIADAGRPERLPAFSPVERTAVLPAVQYTEPLIPAASYSAPSAASSAANFAASANRLPDVLPSETPRSNTLYGGARVTPTALLKDLLAPLPENRAAQPMAPAPVAESRSVEPQPVFPNPGGAPVYTAPVEPKTERNPVQEISDQIAAVESRNSPFAGSDATFQSRTGQTGFDKLLIQEVDLEASTTLSNQIRVSITAKPVYLDAGTPDGTSTLRYGLLPAGSTFGAQTASGLGAEGQISTQNMGISFGLSPNGFLVKNMLGGVRLRPFGGPLTFMLTRDNVKDTMLSYAGARDPVSNQVWGGVVANTGAVIANFGDAASGFYASAGYQTITGKLVANNTRLDGNAGTYWRVIERKEGSLTVGLNFSAMHYDKNLRYFTLGQGGYFSPQQYFLLNVPVRWTGTWRKQLLYTVGGSIGTQHFEEDASPYFPTSPTLEGKADPYYSGLSSTGANYNMDVKLAYQLTPHWFIGAALNVNNARNYATQTATISVKYIFEARPLIQDGYVPSVPDWKGVQPFRLP